MILRRFGFLGSIRLFIFLNDILGDVHCVRFIVRIRMLILLVLVLLVVEIDDYGLGLGLVYLIDIVDLNCSVYCISRSGRG